MSFAGSDSEDKLCATTSISKRPRLPTKVICFHILFCKPDYLCVDIGLELILFSFSFLSSFSMTATRLITPLSLGSYVQVCNWEIIAGVLTIPFNSLSIGVVM